MTPYQFQVRLDREPTELEIEALGTVCDDAGLSYGNGTGELDFERDAPSFADAVFSAITDVEAATGHRARNPAPPGRRRVQRVAGAAPLGTRPRTLGRRGCQSGACSLIYRSPSSIRASRSKHTCAAATEVISAWS